MRVKLGLLVIAVTAASTAWGADEGDNIPTVQIPNAYFLGSGPSGLTPPTSQPEKMKAATEKEKPAVVNGTAHAVIAPVYDGSNGTTSFIRLFNGGSVAATFSVIVIGSPSGNTYGTGNIIVPVRASPQLSITQIRTATNAAVLAGGDTTYSIYLQSQEPTAGYQHVTYNGDNFFFENSSVCKTLLNQSVASVANSVVLTNVHTSRLSGYPSQIELHNFWNAAVTYRVTVIDNNTGAVIGQVNVQTAANASYAMPFSFFEEQIPWQPTADQRHANIVVTDISGAVPNVVVGQSIINQGLNATINMSTACAVNAVSGNGDGGGFGGGGISY